MSSAHNHLWLQLQETLLFSGFHGYCTHMAQVHRHKFKIKPLKRTPKPDEVTSRFAGWLQPKVKHKPFRVQSPPFSLPSSQLPTLIPTEMLSPQRPPNHTAIDMTLGCPPEPDMKILLQRHSTHWLQDIEKSSQNRSESGVLPADQLPQHPAEYLTCNSNDLQGQLCPLMQQQHEGYRSNQPLLGGIWGLPHGRKFMLGIVTLVKRLQALVGNYLYDYLPKHVFMP